MPSRMALLLIGIGCLAGCTPGFLYTDHTYPLVTNMNSTPAGEQMATLDARQIKEPFTTANLTAQWNSKAIGEAAKVEGLQEIYYADLNTFSLLGGLWRQETIQVWGRKPH